MMSIGGVTASAAALAICSPALATSTYIFSGTFAPATSASYTTLLGGGSFDGVFSFTNNTFPTADGTGFQSYTLNLRNSAGLILLTLNSSIRGDSGYIGTSYTSIYGGSRIYFYDGNSDYLQLVVPTGFTGTGSILSNGYSYAQIAPQNQATVRAGTVTRLPEPASWALVIVGFGAIGAITRRHRVTVSFT